MSQKDTLRDYIRAAFAENLGLKVLSLGCSVALWAFTHGPEQTVRTLSVGIISEMPDEARNRTLVTPLPNEIGITLRGPRMQIADLDPKDVGPLRLNLSAGRDARIEIDKAMFNIPDGMTVEHILPSSITVKWDDLVRKSLRIEVPRTGEPAPGCVVKGGVTTAPLEVQARGPRSLIDVMQVVRASPFDVTGLAEGAHTQTLQLDRPSASFVTYDVSQVTASVEIARQLITKTFSKLKVEVIGPPRATTRPNTVTIIFTGTAEALNAVPLESVVPRVEPKAVGHDVSKPGNDNLPVLIDLPKGVTAQIEPPKVVASW